jgi:3-(3-hydroxy-phenyl)propionate hydroxylase
MAGNLLGMQGKKVLIIEKRAALYTIPRAIHGDARMREAFEHAGLWEMLAPHIAPMERMRFADLSGNLLLELEMGSHDFWFFQPKIEEVLLKGLERFASVELRYNTDFQEYTDNQTHIAVHASNGESWQCIYLVGCDGAHSAVRQAAGIALEDFNFEQRWAVFDIYGNGQHLPPCHQQYCGTARAITFVPGVPPHLRWEIRLQAGEDASALLLHTLLPATANMPFIRASAYVFHARLAKKLCQGNIYLLGDAAHQMPPFAGQGLCTGFQDALVFTQALEKGKLPAYELQQRKSAKKAIRSSILLGHIINPQYKWQEACIHGALRVLHQLPWLKKAIRKAMVA